MFSFRTATSTTTMTTSVLKAGRDFDGLRVGRPTEYVFIRDNLIRRGGGIISFGSETSGGIRHVAALNNRGVGRKKEFALSRQRRAADMSKTFLSAE
jgi:polygalacturonase